MSMRRRPIKLTHPKIRSCLTAAVVAVAVTACSLVGVAYDNLEWYVLRETDGLVALTEPQKETLRVDFRRAQARHRAEQLPMVIAYIDGLADAAEYGLTRPQAECAVDWARGLYRETAALAVPASARLLASLSQSQQIQLSEALAERGAEYREEYLDPDAVRRVQVRAERATEFIEYLTADLEPPQRLSIEAWSAATPDTAEAWLNYRTAEQSALLSMLAQGASEAELEGRLRRWWVDRADIPPSLLAQVQVLEQSVVDLSLSLYRTLSSGQRQHAQRRLRNLADDLRALLPKSDGAVQGVMQPPSSVPALVDCGLTRPDL